MPILNIQLPLVIWKMCLDTIVERVHRSQRGTSEDIYNIPKVCGLRKERPLLPLERPRFLFAFDNFGSAELCIAVAAERRTAAVCRQSRIAELFLYHAPKD